MVQKTSAFEVFYNVINNEQCEYLLVNLSILLLVSKSMKLTIFEHKMYAS